MQSTQDIMTLLGGFLPYARDRYGITRLGVFGSVARGEQTEDSDVDVCYEGRALSLLTLKEVIPLVKSIIDQMTKETE